MTLLWNGPREWVVGPASGISADGSVIVGGTAVLATTEAFRWTAEGGAVGLGYLPRGAFDYSEAWGVSGDGVVVVGMSRSSEGFEAFRWTDETGMVGLGDLPGGRFDSWAGAISADGSVIVGNSSSSQAVNSREAFRWTSESGMTGLGVAPGANGSTAYGVSGDGSIIVGQNGGAFVWDEVGGDRRLRDVLTDEYGLDLDGWRLGAARGISDDGTVIVGQGYNPAGDPEGWVAVLVEPVLASAASGDWHQAATWNGGGVRPSAIHDVRIGPHTVTAGADAAASLLSIDKTDARLAIGPGSALTVVNDVELSAGTLDIALGGTLSAGGNIQMQAEAEYACALGGGGRVGISVSGYAAIEGSLTLYAAAPIKDSDGQPTWGDLALTVLDAHGPAGRSGTFTNDLAVGDYLGYGIWFGDRLGRGVIYTDNTVEVAVFQAAAGDTNGDRILDGYDLQAIQAAQTFGTGRKADWTTGDFTDGVNGTSAGVTDGEDLQAILATGLWGTPQPYAAVGKGVRNLLPERPEGCCAQKVPDPFSPAVDPGEEGDGMADLYLNVGTGRLELNTDGVILNGYVIKSRDGIFTGEPAQNLGAFQIDNDQEISGNFFFTLDGEHEFGNVIGPEFLFPREQGDFYLADLTFTYTRNDMPGTFFGTLLVIPEPGTLVMLLAVALGLPVLSIRRKL